MDCFSIKTEVFEGPLDLLLSLIEKRKLLINDISLAKITDEYLCYIKENPDMSISKNSNFIIVASTLLLIKSRSLLPTIKLTEEEEESIDDLEKRLKIYNRLKEVETEIANKFGKDMLFTKRNIESDEIIFTPTKQISTQKMQESVMKVLSTLPDDSKIKKAIIKKVISLEEVIEKLKQKVQQGISTSFKEFSNYDKADKVNVIVSFLAMLELVKNGLIETRQNNHYDDISIETKICDVPKYL